MTNRRFAPALDRLDPRIAPSDILTGMNLGQAAVIGAVSPPNPINFLPPDDGFGPTPIPPTGLLEFYASEGSEDGWGGIGGGDW